MIIDAQFDSSTTGAPAGFFTAVNAAVAYWEREIINPITVTIVFGYNEVDGQTIGTDALAESESSGILDTYAQVVSGLTFAATSANDAIAIAHLPGSDPSSGAGFYVSLAEAEVFGQFPTSNTIVGYAGLSSAFTFTFDPNNRSVSGEYDAIGAMEHEISEVLGRIAGSGVPQGGVAQFSPLDLFRYASPGQLAVTPEGASFSIDGSTMLLPFNNPGPTGANGDAGDWATPPVFGDSFGSGSPGTAGLVSPTDLTLMDVLGYALALDPSMRNDFSGDGLSDILWRDANGSVNLYTSNGGGGFTGFTSQGLGVVDNSWGIEQTGDFNGDGKADILWRNANGDVYLDLSNSGTGFTGVAGQDLGVIPTSWTIEQVGDFNGDGKADILWRNTNGDVELYLSKAGAAFAGFTGQDIGVIPTSWSIQSVGDFNGDGKSDILWRNSNGDVYVYLSKSGSGFTGFTGLDLGVVPTSWTIQQVGDFNGDGKADILWRNSNGDVELYLSNTGAGFTGFTGQDLGIVNSAWSIQRVGDYNGDGKADILWRNTNGDVGFWLSNAGAGYTGFTSRDFGVVGTDWKIVGDSPPPLGATPGPGAARPAPITAASTSPSLTNTGPADSYDAGGAAAVVAHQLAVTDPSSTTLASATHGGADATRTLTINVDDGAHLPNSLETSLTVTDPFQASLHAHSDFMLFG